MRRRPGLLAAALLLAAPAPVVAEDGCDGYLSYSFDQSVSRSPLVEGKPDSRTVVLNPDGTLTLVVNGRSRTYLTAAATPGSTLRYAKLPGLDSPLIPYRLFDVTILSASLPTGRALMFDQMLYWPICEAE